MNDDERDVTGLSPAEEALSQRLAALGPVIRELERAEVEIDGAFAANLRARLVRGAARPRRGSSRVATALRQPELRAAALVVAAAVATIVAVVSLLQPASFRPPYPRTADLVFSFPAPSVTIRQLSPLLSLIHPAPGRAYAGHLTLRASHLPAETGRLRAYRLAPPSDVTGLGRRLFGIRSAPRRVSAGSTVWVVAADGGFGTHRPLHSMAVSLATGELIYHDRRNGMLRRAGHALERDVAVALARRWLERLGWPGGRMPVRSSQLVPGVPKVRQVVLGWPGVGRAATEEATLWVTPNRSVIEVWAWPPVAQSGLIPARPLSILWPEVQQGWFPLAVEGVPSGVRGRGAGRLEGTSVVAVLVPGRGGVYLVPAYRFEGKAHIRGERGEHTWYSLAPSGTR